MNSLSSDHSVKSESKHENSASINQQQPNLPPMSGGVMYGAGNGAVGAVTPSTEQAYQPPTRFPNTVWHQANNPDPNTIGAWTPQGQFIQQVPTHQLEDIRYSQYGISPYPPQATTVTYQSTSGFIQQNGIYTNTSAQNVGTAPSPQGNMASQASMPTAQRATPNHMNGNVEYSVEQSPRPADPYINGNYSHNNQEVVGGSAPPSRCGSAQMEGASEGGGKYTNPPTPTTPQSNQQTQQNGSQQSAQQSGAQQQQGNAMPGYPPHPPQSVQQSLHNSSGYPGQSNNSIQNGMLGEVKEQNQKGGSNEEMWNGNVKRKEGEWTNEREGPWSSEGTRDSNRETPGRPPDPPIWEQQWNNQDWNRQQPAKESSPVKEERNKAWERQWNGQNNEWNGHSKDNSPVKNEKNSQWEQQWNGQSGEWNETSKEDSPNKEEGNRHWERQWNGQAPEWNGQSKGSNDGSQQQWQTEHPWNQDKKDSDRNQLNNRLKTMILNKQQFQQEGRQSNEIRQSIYQQDQNTYKNGGSSSNNSENFLLYGHHPQELASEGGGAGAMDSSKKFSALQNSNHAETNGWVPKEQCFDNRGLDIKPNINFKATKIKEETWNHCTQTDQYCNQDNKQVLQKDLYFGMSNQCVGTNNTSPTFPPTLYQNEYKTKEAEVQSDNSDAFKIPESGNFSSRNVYTSNSTNSLFNKDTNHLKSPLPSPLNNFQIKQEEMLSKVKLENDKGTETDNIGAKSSSGVNSKEFTDYIDKLKNNVKTEIPVCSCLSGDVGVTEPEPGSYYTHLGAAPSLLELRTSTEQRTGLIGNAIRIEKIVYTGKEGKTTSGCPLAKWIIRRSNLDEKLLMVVKHRPGHTCQTAWIVVVIVAWEGVPRNDADILYTMLSYKLNKFGLTTSRRCATNEPRTCACQGLDPQSCGASFSFGCSWSMYYNGCKFARSKHVRKFRLTVKTEEKEVEEKMQKLATVLGPLYRVLAPESYRNQVQFESEAAECRLGSTPGQPFSGVTACIDFCAHAHKDIHNMNNGCTVVVTLNKHRTLEKPEDEQLHVLPLYVIDETDEYGDEAAQKQKVKSGAIEHLTKFPCEVRVRSVPLTPCRRRKKRKDETDLKAKRPNIMPPTNPVKTENQWSNCLPSSQLQIPQVTSTVGDSRSWSPYTVPVTNWTSDRRTPLPPWSSVHTSWNRSITSPQHASFHSTHYQGSWSSMNLNEGLPLDDQVKMDPDSTTLSPSLLKGVSPMQWPNGIKREIIEPDYTGKTQLNNSTHFQDSMLNNKSLKIKEEIPNYYNNCATNNTSPNSNVNKVANNCVNPMSINFLSSNESKKSPMATLPSSKSPGTPSSHLFKSELPPIGDNSKHVNDSSLPPSDNFKTPQVPKQKGFSQNEPIAVTVKSERRNSCETPNTGCNIGQNQKKTESLPVNGFDSTYSYQNFQNHLSPSYVNFSHSYRMNNAYQSSNYLSQASLHSHLSSSYAKSDDQSKMFYSQMDLNKSVNHQSAHFYPHSQGLGIGNQFLPWNAYGPTPYLPPSPKPEPIGHVSSIIDNAECFQDSQMGGVAIALGHGSVLFECAKHELHATTALRRPDRHHPTRISLVFYQHRNLNKPNHGADHWEEKMRLRKEQPPTPDPVTIPSTEPQFPFPTGQFSVNSAQVPLGNNQFLPENQFPVNSGQYPTRPYSVQTSQFNSSESQYHQPQTPFPHNSWPTLFPSLHPYPVPLSIYKGNT